MKRYAPIDGGWEHAMAERADGEYVKHTECRAPLFEFLKHGDEKHQAWLSEAINAFFDGRPRPEPK